jgi:hypothetical protein
LNAIVILQFECPGMQQWDSRFPCRPRHSWAIHLFELNVSNFSNAPH